MFTDPLVYHITCVCVPLILNTSFLISSGSLQGVNSLISLISCSSLMVVLSELCALSNNLIMRGKLSVPYDKLSTPTWNLQHHMYCIALLSFACC